MSLFALSDPTITQVQPLVHSGTTYVVICRLVCILHGVAELRVVTPEYISSPGSLTICQRQTNSQSGESRSLREARTREERTSGNRCRARWTRSFGQPQEEETTRPPARSPLSSSFGQPHETGQPLATAALSTWRTQSRRRRVCSAVLPTQIILPCVTGARLSDSTLLVSVTHITR